VKEYRWVGLPKLVAAVSNAGGLGILTGLTPGSPEKLREAIRETRKLTSKPLYVLETFPLRKEARADEGRERERE